LEPYWILGIPKPFIRVTAIPGHRIELSVH